MALLTCHECGNQVSDTALSCPKCGAVFGKPKPAEAKKPGGCLIAAGLLAGLVVLSSVFRACTAQPSGDIRSEITDTGPGPLLVAMNDSSLSMEDRSRNADQVIARFPDTEYAKQAQAFLKDPKAADAKRKITSTSAADAKKRYDQCAAQMKRIDGMVTDMDITGHAMKVYVTPRFINGTTIQQKSGFFELIQCIGLKGEDSMIPMQILDARNGQQIGRWDGRRVRMD